MVHVNYSIWYQSHNREYYQSANTVGNLLHLEYNPALEILDQCLTMDTEKSGQGT